MNNAQYDPKIMNLFTPEEHTALQDAIDLHWKLRGCVPEVLYIYSSSTGEIGMYMGINLWKYGSNADVYAGAQPNRVYAGRIGENYKDMLSVEIAPILISTAPQTIKTRRFRVVEWSADLLRTGILNAGLMKQLFDQLPADAKIIDFGNDVETCYLKIESDSFDVVTEGQLIPRFIPVFHAQPSATQHVRFQSSVPNEAQPPRAGECTCDKDYNGYREHQKGCPAR